MTEFYPASLIDDALRELEELSGACAAGDGWACLRMVGNRAGAEVPLNADNYYEKRALSIIGERLRQIVGRVRG